MTRKNEEMATVRKIIVVVDIRSSSDIIEGVTLNGELKKLRNLLISVKQYLTKESTTLHFEIYKFTGDGWILLFPENAQIKKIMNFVQRLSKYFQKEFNKEIEPILDTPPPAIGLTFGAAEGELIKIIMNNRTEYIGRALNIACRLQSRVTAKNAKEESNGYKMLIPNHFYSNHRQDFEPYNPKLVVRTLKNIRGGRNFRCALLSILK